MKWRRRKNRRARRILRLRLKENFNVNGIRALKLGEKVKQHGLIQRDANRLEKILEQLEDLSEELTDIVGTTRVNESYMFPKMKTVLFDVDSAKDRVEKIINQTNR